MVTKDQTNPADATMKSGKRGDRQLKNELVAQNLELRKRIIDNMEKISIRERFQAMENKCNETMHKAEVEQRKYVHLQQKVNTIAGIVSAGVAEIPPRDAEIYLDGESQEG